MFRVFVCVVSLIYLSSCKTSQAVNKDRQGEYLVTVLIEDNLQARTFSLYCDMNSKSERLYDGFINPKTKDTPLGDYVKVSIVEGSSNNEVYVTITCERNNLIGWSHRIPIFEIRRVNFSRNIVLGERLKYEFTQEAVKLPDFPHYQSRNEKYLRKIESDVFDINIKVGVSHNP